MSVADHDLIEPCQLDRLQNDRIPSGASERLIQRPLHRPTEGEVRFESLSVAHRGMVLLANANITIPTGTTMAIMGRSGAGKTSLLRVIAGLAQPVAGQIHRPEGRVPIVFQEPRLLPWRTARQNVELVLPKSERYKALEWLDRVGLADAVEKYPLTLSGGMRQRVSIARALACESPLVLVDEPFSHLDVITANQLRTELKQQLTESGRTCIWVTHDPAEAATVAHSTLVMNGPPNGSWKRIQHYRYSTSEHLTTALANALDLSGIRSNEKEIS